MQGRHDFEDFPAGVRVVAIHQGPADEVRTPVFRIIPDCRFIHVDNDTFCITDYYIAIQFLNPIHRA